MIDSHVHTWTHDILSKSDIEARTVSAQRVGTKPILDSPASVLKAAMKGAGVERAVILPIDSGVNQEMPLGLREKTEWHVSEIANDSSLITFVGLDPRRGREGLQELRRAVVERGCRGLKLYPPNGFYPDDDRAYPYYRLALDLGIPVVIHQGFTSRFKHVKYARPVYVDKVAVDFPELNLVLAHVGTPWHEEAIMVAMKNPNVYLDVSGLQVFASRIPSKVYQLIGDAMLMKVFPKRFLWGSDYPLFEHFMPLSKWAQFFTEMQMPAHLLDMGYPAVSRSDLEQVMWSNSAKLFFGET